MAKFILFKPDIEFAIEISELTLAAINKVKDSFFIKREFESIIERKCEIASFPVYLSENSFHYLDRMNREHLPYDPCYFSSYGTDLLFDVIFYAKEHPQYNNIQNEKEVARVALIQEICKALNREVSGVELKAIDFFIKKVKG